MSDPVDNTLEVSSISDNSAETTATVDVSSPVDTATSDNSPQSSVHSDGSTDPAQAATQATTDSTGSLVTPNTTLQNAKPAAAPINWEQRYGELRKREQAQAAEVQRFKQQQEAFKGVDPSAVKQWREAQQRAQAEQLPPWNRQHPANARFSEAKVKWGAYKQAMARASTPEQKEWVQQALGGQFEQEDLNVLRAWDQHQRTFAEGFASDPEGSIADIVDRRVKEALGKHQEHAQAETKVGAWFDDAANKPLIERYGPLMANIMQRGGDFELAKESAVRQYRIDSLQSRVGDADKAQASAQEQARLLKGAAAVTHDPKVAVSIDPMSVARARGIQPGTDRYYDLLTELKEQGQI